MPEMPEQSLVHALVAHGGHRCHAPAVKWEAGMRRGSQSSEDTQLLDCLQPSVTSLLSL